MEDQKVRHALYISGLITSHLEETAGTEQERELSAWLQADPGNRQLFEKIVAAGNAENYLEEIQGYDSTAAYLEFTKRKATNTEKDQQQQTALKTDRGRKGPMLLFYIAAALALFTGSYLYFLQPRNSPSALPEIMAGSNKAVLTLSGGRRISLIDAPDGRIAEQAGITIRKTRDGQVTYRFSAAGATISKAYNSIVTPRGGQYEIVLPDGSAVRLNAGSALKFPATFAGLKKRIVELQGEAYFKIAHNKAIPFVVKAGTQEVTVLGTQFNVNSYPEEGKTVTTLEQGLVRLSSGSQSVTIKPGEQAVTQGSGMRVSKADLQSALAWKNGLFLFYNTDLKTIMRQVSRWYDVDVDINSIPEKQFYGEISRDVKLTDVLTMLESTGKLKFKVQGRRIMLQQ